MTTKEFTVEFEIKNHSGLHTRPGAYLVNIAKKFESEVLITNLDGKNTPVSAKSLMKLMTLGVKSGHRIKVYIKGSDAEEALKKIECGINDGLGE